MKAVGYYQSLPIDKAEALVDVELPKPTPEGRDLLVEIKAVSVNPVDSKQRKRAQPQPGAPAAVLGYDAAGVVAAVGPQCRLFKPGDAVFYAGSITRPGTNAQFHLVDERIVGPKPRTLGFAAAAALPLTTITAWEMLFDRFGVRPGKPAEAGTLLIVGGAGGVGSIAIQLARRLTGLTVVATASRPETRQWCLELGAHHVVDHGRKLEDGLKAIGLPMVEYIFSTNATEQHFPEFADIVAPQGRVGLIESGTGVIDARVLMPKSASLHWELMFTRPRFGTPDMIAQHKLLAEVSALVDAGVIRTTHSETLGPINAANLRKAHALIESGKTRGKLVLEGF
ncbi:MAG TPA: zinc-binding alcohol dehydrogenase family protein [Alphaproteobacteria bacterium]|nr:zinc-binding alcohol dehydrogenase family protein [Alphaproteobacteria bacterium]